jgi:hypothetical protein
MSTATIEQPPPTSAATAVQTRAALWQQPIEVLGLTGEYASGKTLFGLTIAPGADTLAYDMEKSNATYTTLGFTRVDVPTEMLRNPKFVNGYKPVDTFEWWLAHVRSLQPGRYRVIMLDPVSEIESGLTEWVRTHPTFFGKTPAQYAKSMALMWGDVKEFWKAILADLSSRCETFVFTSHMASVWERDGPTGKRKAKGKETLMELASLYLQMERKKQTNGEIPAKPAAVVLKSRLSSIKFDPATGDTIIIPTLPPRIPVATPHALRQYMAVPPDYSKLTLDELAPDVPMTDEEKAELKYQTARAEQLTEELKLNREERERTKREERAAAAAQVAARQAQQTTTATTPAQPQPQPPAAPSTNGTHAGPSDEQLHKLLSLRSRLFQKEKTAPANQAEVWTAILNRRNVKSARDLTPAQADELIGKLAERVNADNPLDAVFRGAPPDSGTT